MLNYRKSERFPVIVDIDLSNAEMKQGGINQENHADCMDASFRIAKC